jgi:hypothetical protein
MSGDPKALALLNSLQLSGTGKTVALSFAVPSEVLDMIPMHKSIKDGGDHAPLLAPELHSRAPEAPKPPTPPTPDR